MQNIYSDKPKFINDVFDLEIPDTVSNQPSSGKGIDFTKSKDGGFLVEFLSDEELSKEEEESPSQSILRQVLKPIYEHLLQSHVEELAINKPGQVWLKLRQPHAIHGYWQPIDDSRFDKDYLHRICSMMANSSNTSNFGPNGIPVVYGTIPGGHRFAGGVGYNIQYNDPSKISDEGSVCICIRQYITNSPIDLKDYNLAPGQAPEAVLLNLFNKNNDPNDAFAKIYNSLDRGDHILISGATSTGKTQFLNRIIKDVDSRKRVITIEDTREIVIPAENRVHILMSRTGQTNQFTYQNVRDLIVRMTPDIVMAGEISNSNAATIWNLMTTGHGHFMTTIHAESPDEAITTFMSCIAQANAASGVESASGEAHLRKIMSEKLRVIQINKDQNGKRRVTEIR